MARDGELPILQLRGIVKKFGGFTAVNGIDLDIRNGEFFTIVGPSGSGKTTVIRMLVGMDRPTSGEILLDNRVINDVPANKRPTCMVFQSLALFRRRRSGQPPPPGGRAIGTAPPALGLLWQVGPTVLGWRAATNRAGPGAGVRPANSFLRPRSPYLGRRPGRLPCG